MLSFVGYYAAYQQPGALPPPLAGTFGAIFVTWVTFVPSFIWIFLGAPSSGCGRTAICRRPSRW